MERIGRAASKMAQGNLLKYNFFVVVIATLLSLFLFFASGLSVLAALFLVSLVLRPFMPEAIDSGHYFHLLKSCLIAVVSVTAILDILAIVKNIKTHKNKV